MVAVEREVLGWIFSGAVRSAWRGQGIGAALSRALLASFDPTGIARVRPTVAPTNTSARRQHESLGLAVLDEVPDCFGPGEPRLRMEPHPPTRAR